MVKAEQLVLWLHSRGDTRRLGRRLSACLEPGDLLVLEGELGAGKTFLARSIARGLGVPSEIRVTSPTFDLVHELPARIPLLHVDLYRLDHAASLVELGLDERIGGDTIVLVEWGDRFAHALGGEGLWLTILRQADWRRCRLQARGARGERLLGRLAAELVRSGIHGRRCPSSR